MDHDAIVLYQARDRAYRECAFPIWFAEQYAVDIGLLEGFEQGLAKSWLQFGAKYFSNGNWKKDDAIIFVPPSAE